MALAGANFVAQNFLLNRYVAGAVAPAIGPEFKFDVQKKRSRGFQEFASKKRLKLSDFTFASNKRITPALMARRRGRRGRRMRRGRKGRRGFRKRGSFVRRVRRVILRTTEAKKRVNPENATLNLAQGDGTSRIVYVSSPPLDLITGSSAGEIDGNKIFLKGISFRGMVGTSGENTTFNGGLIRVSLVFSREQFAPSTPNWITFGSTTTSTANPTATPPYLNPRFFETTNATNQFVGNGWVIPFDTTRVKVKSSRTLVLNPGTQNNAASGIVQTPTPFDLYYKINKWMTIEDPAQSDITAPLRFKYGTYYLVMQVVANTNDVSTTVVAELQYTLTTYFRDP